MAAPKGLAASMGFQPVTDWIDPRRNTILGLAAGLASGKNLGEGVALGLQGAAQGKQADTAYATAQKAEAERLAQINQTSEWLKANYPQFASLPPAQGFELAAKLIADQNSAGGQPASVQEYEYAKQNGYDGSYADWRKGGTQTVRAGLGQPVPLRNKATGETVPFMPMSDGTYINPLTQQSADETWEFDPAYIAAQRAQGAQIGKETGAAQFDLPAAQLSMQQSLEAINAIRTEKSGMDEQFGKFAGVIPQQMTPAIPGTEKAKFQVAVDRGVNRAFLEAREVLRGGGQITDFESRKAESAITNMQGAMEKGDKAQFERALTDFEAAIKAGYAKLQAQAGGLPAIGGRGAAAAPAAGAVLTYNPATGELE